jgi:hypothetical protein
VIWLKSKFVADHLLKNGTAIFGARGAYCSKWDVKSNEYPCFNCHRQGHRQAECKSVTRCAICSGPHSRHSCPKEKVQCPICNTAGHTAFDWQCPLHPKNWMYKGKERVMTARQTGKERGTTRATQEILAKQKGTNQTNLLKDSQHAPNPSATPNTTTREGSTTKEQVITTVPRAATTK